METEYYCKNCGQPCHPELYSRPREDYDGYYSPAFINDFRSPCCKDELRVYPVSPQCAVCGKIAHPDDTNHGFTGVDGDIMCPDCKKDYQMDHPSLEDLPEDDWRKDR